MSNESAKQELKEWIENAIEEAKNPNPREKAQKERKIKAGKVKQKYGLG